MNRILIGIALLTIFVSETRADESQNYFVAPISTELHRATVSFSVDTYAIVNCNALIADDALHLSKLDTHGFVSALSNVTADRDSLLLVCRYQFPANVETELRNRLNQRLKELCASAGYENVRISETRTSADWLDTFQRAEAFNQPAEAREPLFENEYVRVFPVRTQLSKLVHGEADCIVEVVHPIDGRMEEISPGLEASIRQAVQQAQVIEKHTLKFKLSSTTAGRARVESLFDARSPPEIPETSSAALQKVFEARAAQYKPSPALTLARDLGFQNITYSHSPGGGAPETLVGAEAPNFNLDRLNGDPLDLHDFIKGRPALITFWGLACAPCRQEAPHLTELHEKYGGKFSIVAVNGYDDDRQDVTNYATNEKLSHPIVLQGKIVSDDLYHVGAYPTTFWVDRNGTITDYEIGFTSSKRLEDRIANMLAR
ncbi:TlpA family protein disulfide reductase [Rhodopirellula sp. SWK7]|uniref:TlpA family protein disulfide reductase n=1 Tax=Rhodopirellula sp. SWK7 TaxID=595460 RepID=UPI000346E9A0|nr:TlpA disulfide reductase family protein [Rhodopirellula sp. SWK7]